MVSFRHRASFDDPLSYLRRLGNRMYSLWMSLIYPFAEQRGRIIVHYPIRLDRRRAHQLSLGCDVTIGKDCWINLPGSDASATTLVIGDRCNIGARATLSAKNRITLDADVMISTAVLIQDHHHAYEDLALPISSQGMTEGGRVRIEAGCWIGQGAAIICNEGELVIGRNSVVGANALVTKSCPPHSVILGNPARLARQFDPVRGKWVGGEAGRPVPVSSNA